MNKPIPRGLKTTFLVHTIVATMYGLLFLIDPQIWARLSGIHIDPIDPYRLLGAALLAFAVGSWLAYRETEWERVRITVQVDILWSALTALIILRDIFAVGLPRIEWLNVAILTSFAAVFSLFYFRADAA
jgi:hypothetical protein